MTDRKPLFRMILRSQSRKLRRAGNASDADAIDQVLADPVLFDITHSEVNGKYEREASAGGKLTDILDWILSHSDQIIAFIKMIIALFAPMADAAEQQPA